MDIPTPPFVTYGSRMYAPRIDDQRWDQFKTLLYKLNRERKTRAQMLACLRKLEFAPTASQLHSKMGEWGYKPLSRMSKTSSETSPSSDSSTRHVDKFSDQVSPTVSRSSEGFAFDPTEFRSIQSRNTERLDNTIPDLSGFVLGFSGLEEFDKYDTLNDVAFFLSAANITSEAFHLFSKSSLYLLSCPDVSATSIALSTINRLRTVTLKVEKTLANEICMQAVAVQRLLQLETELARPIHATLRTISVGVCDERHLNAIARASDHIDPNILTSTQNLVSEQLVRWCDPFLATSDRHRFLTQWLDSHQHDACLGWELLEWSLNAVRQAEIDAMLTDHRFDPTSPPSRSIYATILACWLTRLWLDQPITSIVKSCPTVCADDRRLAHIVSFKVSVQKLAVFAHCIIERAARENVILDSGRGSQAITISCSLDKTKLVRHISNLLDQPPEDRFIEFVDMHKNVFKRTLEFRKSMHQTLIADGHDRNLQYIEETAFLLAKTAIKVRLERPCEPATTSDPAIFGSMSTHSGESEGMTRFRRYAKQFGKLSPFRSRGRTLSLPSSDLSSQDRDSRIRQHINDTSDMSSGIMENIDAMETSDWLVPM